MTTPPYCSPADPRLTAKPAPKPVSASASHEIDVLIRARHPIIYVTTGEEKRVECCLREITKRRWKNVFVWTITQGIVKSGSEPNRAKEGAGSTCDPIAALDAVVAQLEPAIYLFKEFRHLREDNRANLTVFRRLPIVYDGRVADSEVEDVFGENQHIIGKRGLLEYHASQSNLAQAAGLENIKDWLAKRSEIFTDQAKQFGLPSPRGVLLFGAQVCGKSLCAKTAANLWNLNRLCFEVGRMFSSLVESSEENVRQSLLVAENVAPTVLTGPAAVRDWRPDRGPRSATTRGKKLNCRIDLYKSLLQGQWNPGKIKLLRSKSKVPTQSATRSYCPWKKSPMTLFHVRSLRKAECFRGCCPPRSAAGTLSTTY